MVDRDDVILDKRSKSTSFKPADEIVKFQVHPTDPTKTASIGAQLSPDVEAALREFLRENWDIFAWHPSDMPGIPRRLAEHSLNILKGFKPVKQTLRRFSEPKRQAMGEELAKLLEAGFIRDIKHLDWLANLVMLPKKDKSWRLRVDFKDLNKACVTLQNFYFGFQQNFVVFEKRPFKIFPENLPLKNFLFFGKVFIFIQAFVFDLLKLLLCWFPLKLFWEFNLFSFKMKLYENLGFSYLGNHP